MSEAEGQGLCSGVAVRSLGPRWIELEGCGFQLDEVYTFVREVSALYGDTKPHLYVHFLPTNVPTVRVADPDGTLLEKLSSALGAR